MSATRWASFTVSLRTSGDALEAPETEMTRLKTMGKHSRSTSRCPTFAMCVRVVKVPVSCGGVRAV